MREKTARKIMSGWSAFTLGMRRPELTVLAVGEWDRSPGSPDWGVVIRDLRTGDERVIFEEQEWKRIKGQGLPPIGADWGEPISAIAASPEVERLVEMERTLYQAAQPSTGAAQTNLNAEGDWSMPEILAYLDFDLGQELAEMENFTPFTRDEIDGIGRAIQRGTPEDVRYRVKPDESEPVLDALTEWLREQRRRGQADSPQLRAILEGKVDIDLSGAEPRFRNLD